MTSTRDMVAYLLRDPSALSLVASNLIVVAMAVVQHWNLITIFWVYWAQSIIIGLVTVYKILLLKDFSTEGFKMGGKSVDPTPATKRQAALMFFVFYGFFHFIYAIFISAFSGDVLHIKPDWHEVGVSSLYFLAHHLFSVFYHGTHKGDKPNIGSILTFPFLRIFPMHISIVIGGGILIATGASTAVLVFFLLLKMIADLVMHAVEHTKGGAL